MKWLKENWKTAVNWMLVLAVLFGIYAYANWYVPYRNLKNGFVIVGTFDCPDYHSIKANKRSMIYHLPGTTYYDRTNAANGACFDTKENAEKQGFRAPYN